MLVNISAALIAVIFMGSIYGAYDYLTMLYPWTAFVLFVMPMGAFMFMGLTLGIRRLILKTLHDGR